jgi:hypothetical protein
MRTLMQPANHIEANKNIEFRLSSIKKISYFEKDPSEYKLTSNDIQQADVNIGVNFTINEQEETISFQIAAVFLYSEDLKKQELFGIETLYTYEIKSLAEHLKTHDKEEYIIPDNLMLTFLNIAISGTRGMLAVLNTAPAYNHLLLPIINPSEILGTLKKQNTLQPNNDSNKRLHLTQEGRD